MDQLKTYNPVSAIQSHQGDLLCVNNLALINDEIIESDGRMHRKKAHSAVNSETARCCRYPDRCSWIALWGKEHNAGWGGYWISDSDGTGPKS